MRLLDLNEESTLDKNRGKKPNILLHRRPEKNLQLLKITNFQYHITPNKEVHQKTF